MKKDALSSRQRRIQAAVRAVRDPKTGAFVFAPKGGAKLVSKGGVTITRKDAAKAKATVVKGEMYLAGHRVAGIMPDGTPILEPVSKPTSFTRKEISDTVREVRSKSKGKHSLIYAD